jgi:hypothetical protein
MRGIKTVFFMAAFIFPPITSLFCQEQDVFFMPLASYEFVNTEDIQIHTPALGFGIMKGKQDVPFTEVYNQFSIIAMYQSFIFKEASYSAPKNYHNIDFLFDGRMERHQFLAIFNADSDKPVAGGLHTFSAAIGWGYELLRHTGISFILGAAIAMNDFGIDLPNGEPLPVLPLPLARVTFKTEWLAGSFDFLTELTLQLTIAPNQRIRLTIEAMSNFQNVLGEGILWYRLFSREHPLEDFAGIGIGIKNGGYGFNLSEVRGKTFEYQYTSVFGVLDMSFVKASAGYIFDSREIYDRGDITKNAGKGYFVSVFGAYQF